jgi:hypothetical protein
VAPALVSDNRGHAPRPNQARAAVTSLGHEKGFEYARQILLGDAVAFVRDANAGIKLVAVDLTDPGFARAACAFLQLALLRMGKFQLDLPIPIADRIACIGA